MKSAVLSGCGAIFLPEPVKSIFPYLEEALKRAELRYKTVKNMMFDSREEAQKARKECEDFEALLASCRAAATGAWKA